MVIAAEDLLQPPHGAIAREERATESDVRPQERLRILLIDDEPEVLEIFAVMLRRRGWEVVGVASAMQGLEAWNQGEFNLILMDVQMPEVSGLEATRVIRSRERESDRSYTPIVALTAWASPEFRRACRAAGMDDFIAKPVGMAALWSAVERNVRHGASH